jgi:ABC-type transport system involved in multi-copper enzyme maturation permease subunit
MKSLRQVFAIARTEFRFGLRRAAPVVVTAIIGLIVGAALLLDPIANLDFTSFDEFSPQQVEALNKMGITPEIYLSLSRDSIADISAISTVFGWYSVFLALLLLPMATAGVIPADRQFGVLELLRSTPVRGSTYLAGKMLGVLGIICFIALFPLLLFFAVLEGILLSVFQVGIPFYLVGFYLKLTFMDGLPILVFGSLIGVLSGIAFHSRRAAVFPGLLAGILSLLAWMKVFPAPETIANDIDKAAYYVFQHYQSISQASWDRIVGSDSSAFDLSLLGANAPIVSIGQVLGMYASVLIVLFTLAVLARLWFYQKENF